MIDNIFYVTTSTFSPIFYVELKNKSYRLEPRIASSIHHPAAHSPAAHPWPPQRIRRGLFPLKTVMSSKRPSPDAEQLRTPSQSSKQARLLPVPTPATPGPALRFIPVDSPVLAVKGTTCLSLGLYPSDIKQPPRICNKCLHFWEKKLNGNLKQHQPARSGRTSYDCERSFDPGVTADPYKLLACEQFKALFSVTCVTPASVGQCVTPSNKPKSW